MKYLALTITFVLLTGGLLTGQDHRLLPAPKKIVVGKGKFLLEGAKILVSADLLEREHTAISRFTGFVKEMTGIAMPVAYAEEPGAKVIVLNSDQAGIALPVPDEKTGPGTRESYQIAVSDGRITVNAKTDAGIFYALQTLEQMVVIDQANSFIMEAQIEDYPEMAYRGVMIDFSHGGLLTEEEIRNQIDFLSRWKMNQYYFYNEVSIEMKSYPLISYNACYSQEQIKRIVSNARKKHIAVFKCKMRDLSKKQS